MYNRGKKIVQIALDTRRSDAPTDENEENIPFSSSENFINTGKELMIFKYDLRKKKQTGLQECSVSGDTKVIYSPIVSEYVPSENNIQADTIGTSDAATESLDSARMQDLNEELLYDKVLEELQPVPAEITLVEELRQPQMIETLWHETSFLHLNMEAQQEYTTEVLAESNDQHRNNDLATTSTNIENRDTTEVSVENDNEHRENDSPTISTNIENSESTPRNKKKYPKKTLPGRKRLLNKDGWNSTVSKTNKNLGLEYTNKKGILIEKKVMKKGCGNCFRKCEEKITDEQRNNIFKSFWAIGNHNQQANFISRCVKRVPKKQIIASSAQSSRRKWSYEYYFYVDGQETRTCKKMFLNTLSISDMWLQTLFKKIDSSAVGEISLDMRGRHKNRVNIVPDFVKESVREHISLIPLVESHYVRKRTSKLYFDEQLNLPKLYTMYKEWMESTYPDKQIATSRQFREIFHKEYNIDFNKPKKDLCPKCDIFRNASEVEKANLEYDHSLHLANKFVVRNLKDSDKMASANSGSILTACYDMQKVLSTPQSEVSIFYYKRKLNVFNFTIFDIGKREGYSYVWDETIGKKGSNEISSYVFDFIKKKYQEGYKTFNFYSDSCGGQNKNRIVFGMYAYASKLFNINIYHNFFEVGHSQSEGDAMHALIERRKKNKTIYVPQQWVTLIRCAKTSGKAYDVQEISQNQIYDFKSRLPLFNNWETDADNRKVNWNKIQHLHFTQDSPNIMFFAYDFISDKMAHIDLGNRTTLRTSRRSKINQPALVTTDEVPLAYRMPLPISSAKYKDLLSLCKSKVIPSLYHNYYTNLPVSNNMSNSQEENSDSD